jgi:peptidyl-prolyl cis-trans isomerase A (cyclophilin A)
MLLLMFAIGCKDAQMEADNARLQQRVADLERANERLEQENGTLKATVQRVESAAQAASQQATMAGLGVGAGQKLTATFVTTLGEITCVLRPEQAPETVLNFVQLAKGEREWTDPKTGQKTKRPLYDGTIFHRVIPSFMIQGGDPLGTGRGGPGYKFADEVGEFTVFDKPGLLAMANAGPNTNGSQFFITDSTPSHLNGKHTIFGDCENLDVVRKITEVPRNGQDKPDTDVVLTTVRFGAR